MIGISQTSLAESAGVNVNTIRAMEARGGQVLKSGLGTVRKVQAALEGQGVAFLFDSESGPGVRLAHPQSLDIAS
ncbi:MAG: hypothetical protein AAFO70_05670 [Pseudomonadota bacterium]